MQSDAAITSGVYASFASLTKFGGRSRLSEAPQTWNQNQIYYPWYIKHDSEMHNDSLNEIPDKASLEAGTPPLKSNLMAANDEHAILFNLMQLIVVKIRKQW